MDKVKLSLSFLVIVLLLAVAGLSVQPRIPSAGSPSLTTTTTTETSTSFSTITSTLTSVNTNAVTTTTTAISTSVTTTTVVTTLTTTVAASTVTKSTPIEVYFSPDGGAADKTVFYLDEADSSVCGMIYSFTRDDIAAAFIRAYQRGVQIKLSFDSAQPNAQGGEYYRLLNASVPVRVDERNGLMHNKVLIIDGRIVITGSYNWSDKAEDENRENLIIIEDPNLAAKYLANCEATWNASQQVSRTALTNTTTTTTTKTTNTTTTTTTTTTKTNQSSSPPPTPGVLEIQMRVAQDPITRGSTQTIYVTVTSNGNPIEGAAISGTITYASGSKNTFTGFTNINGSYSYSWQIGGNSSPGTFKVSVTASKTGYTSGQGYGEFTVRTAS